MGLSPRVDIAASLAVMAHAYCARKPAANNHIEIRTSVVHALLNARYYDASRNFDFQNSARREQPIVAGLRELGVTQARSAGRCADSSSLLRGQCRIRWRANGSSEFFNLS